MKGIVYMLFVDVWRLAARFGFREMGDGEWESFIRSGQKLVMRYRPQGRAMERLCRDLLGAIQTFLADKGTE